MARDAVAVDARLVAAVAAGTSGVNVAALCRELGVSRATFYKYVKRFAERGLEGFYPDSRRPRRSPTQVGPAVEEAIVRGRKELDDAGWDAGAISIRGWLLDNPHQLPDQASAPSRATVHRVLVRRGMVTPAPAKRPLRGSLRRFVAAKANEMWQMDGFEVPLADGGIAVVIQIVDDCTRTDLACHVAKTENGVDAWAAFTTAADRYGLPARLLTDNGSAFSGKRRGWSSALETGARHLGVHPICSSVDHPQTCGKIERMHATTEKWLARRPTPATLGDLQELLEQYRIGYNNRRHQSLGGLTPNQRWQTAERDHPAAGVVNGPLAVTQHAVTATGSLGLCGTLIGVGRRHAGSTATVFRSGEQASIFINAQLVRHLTIDRTRPYHPQEALLSTKS